ncbi:hypothetical protein ACVT98_17825 [Vibrio campbellii]
MSPKQIANLLCALPFARDAWERAAQLLGENQYEYWRNTDANTYDTEDDAEYALSKLLEHDRPSAVINGLSRNVFDNKGVNPELACEALLALVKSEDQVGRVDSYHITQIIKSLQQNSNTDEDKLFQVEWAYVSLLDQHSEGSPVTLERRLASTPSFFCELIQLIYRAKGVEADAVEPTEQSRNVATNAYRLLSAWRTVPGTKPNGEFNPEAFTVWLATMEGIVKASGHYDVALIQLGDVLIHSPAGGDGLWIHPVIANAMNSRERSSLRDGYRTGISIHEELIQLTPKLNLKEP